LPKIPSLIKGLTAVTAWARVPEMGVDVVMLAGNAEARPGTIMSQRDGAAAAGKTGNRHGAPRGTSTPAAAALFAFAGTLPNPMAPRIDPRTAIAPTKHSHLPVFPPAAATRTVGSIIPNILSPESALT
jgi:hypothetical protein